MSKLDFISEELDQAKAQGLFINIRTIGSPQGAWIKVDNKKVLNLCSNNYLGFANNETLRNAAKNAIDNFGVGPAAVRTIAGTMVLHKVLEDILAKFNWPDLRSWVVLFQVEKIFLPVIPTSRIPFRMICRFKSSGTVFSR